MDADYTARAMIPAEELELNDLARIWRCRLERPTIRQLLDYCGLLLVWGERINLTGASSVRDLVRHHLPDSFALASRAQPGSRVVDVGSGGGLPAIPFALLRPDCPVLLVEPTAKKVAFLRTALREIRIGTASILPGRFDARVPRKRAAFPTATVPTEPTPPPEVTFDLAVSRAAFPIADWLPLGASLVQRGGRVVAFATGRVKPPPTAPLTLIHELPYTLMDSGRRWLLEYERST